MALMRCFHFSNAMSQVWVNLAAVEGYQRTLLNVILPVLLSSNEPVDRGDGRRGVARGAALEVFVRRRVQTATARMAETPSPIHVPTRVPNDHADDVVRAMSLVTVPIRRAPADMLAGRRARSLRTSSEGPLPWSSRRTPSDR